MATKIVLDRDPSTASSWTLTHINASTSSSSTSTMNGKLFVLDGDFCDEYKEKPLLVKSCTPYVQGTGGITINDKKMVLDGDPLSCGDNIIASGPASILLGEEEL